MQYRTQIVNSSCSSISPILPKIMFLQSKGLTFLISNFCRVLNVVRFLLGNFPVSEFYMPTFRNILVCCIFIGILLGNSPASEFYMLTFRTTLSVPSSYLPAYEDGTECSEMLAYKTQMPGNYPEESVQQMFNTSM